MSPLTTHVLDTALGLPAAGLRVQLARQRGDAFEELCTRTTNADGRIPDLSEGELAAGSYRLRFDSAAYFALTQRPCFYPYVDVVFLLPGGTAHHHVPLLLSPFGYSTYRGS